MNNLQKARNRLRLSPLEKEILWTLREAGEENLSTLLNTVEALGAWSSHEEFLSACEIAVKNLLSLQYIELCIEQENNSSCRLVPFVGVQVLLNRFLQRGSSREWTQRKSLGGQGKIVVVLLVDVWE